MSNRIKKMRLEKKISQQKLADEIGVTRQAISLFEKGEREPKLETWIKLTKYFDVPMDYLQGSMSYLNYKKSEEARNRASYHIDKVEKIVIEALNEPNKSKESLEKYTEEIYKEIDFVKKEFENMQNLKP